VATDPQGGTVTHPADSDAESWGDFAPWQYATGLGLWAAYIAAWLLRVPLPWRLPLGIAAPVLWTWGVILRRKHRRRALMTFGGAPVSEVSRFIDPGPRVVTSDELRLLRALLRRATPADPVSLRLETLRVRGYDDGGMGSLRLLPDGADRPGRRFGQQVAEIQFHDTDGVLVSVTLNLDEQGDLFEVDVFKGDSSPLQRIPVDL